MENNLVSASMPETITGLKGKSASFANVYCEPLSKTDEKNLRLHPTISNLIPERIYCLKLQFSFRTSRKTINPLRSLKINSLWLRSGNFTIWGHK